MTWACESGTSGSFAGNAEGDSCVFFTGDDSSQGSELGFWLWVSSTWPGPAVSLASFQSAVGTEPALHLYLGAEPSLHLAYAETFPGTWSFSDLLGFPPMDCWCWISLSAGFGAVAWSIWTNDGLVAAGHEAMPGPSGGYSVSGGGTLALGTDVSGLGGAYPLDTDGGVKLARLLYIGLALDENQTDPDTSLSLVQELTGEGSRAFLIPRMTDWPVMTSARAGNFSGATGAFSGPFVDAGQGYGLFTTAPHDGFVFADGPQPAMPPWVRLSHASGQGYWQSRGDVTEEWAGGAKRLSLPFAVLSEAADTLMGRDPSTNLPAFCASPTVVKQYVPTPTPLPPPTPPLGTTATCGAATQMATWLEGVYSTLSSWVGGLESSLLGLTVDLLINVAIDALTGGAGLVVGIFDQAAIATVAAFISTHLVGTDWPYLTSAENDIIRNTCYCALGGAGGTTTITDAILADWSSRLNAENTGTNFPSGVTVPVLRLVMLCPGVALWQGYANTGAQNPTSACSGVSCP